MLAGTALAGAALAAALAGVVVELELELLLQPAAASIAAATAAKPILLSLRTVVPSWGGSFMSIYPPEASRFRGIRGVRPGSARRRIRLPSDGAGSRSMALSGGIEKP
ncbi:MAG TPA: hypothetical protein VJ254_14410, partial [Streptosporangiaceae bacterium]|nr:hypothetical protein [Streptosporangiaceae bacterium]